MTTVSRVTQEAVRQRAGGRCEYCQCPERFATQLHSTEHVRPRAKGGADTLDNLALCCQGCNNHKFIKTEVWDSLTGETVPMFHPREMRWDDHFAWSNDYVEVIPLTAVGRATVREMHLNRMGVCNIRRVLFAMGEHPPRH